jgi:WD40-like Beta Propeller Repeat
VQAVGGPRHRTRAVVCAAAAALALLAAGCTSGGTGPGLTGTSGPGGPPAYHPTGKIVILAGRFLSSIRILDAASDSERELRLPVRGGSYDSAWPSPDGRFYVMPLEFSGQSRNQMFLLSSDGPPQKVGPAIEGVGAYQVAAGWALAWACPGDMSLLDLAHPTAWRKIGHACAGAISPDGKQLAFASETALYLMDLPNGEPREVLRFRDLPELRRAQVVPRSLDQMLWGPPGLAIGVGDASRTALVIWRDGRPPLVHPLGTARLGDMDWQPGGRLLAFFDYAPRGEVFTLDPDTGAEKQIASTGDFGRLTWSPDGKVVASSRSPNVVALVDGEGRGQVGTLVASGVPLVWLGA